ncbi:FUSC family protein [Kitasatospora mediocidica]|uniref:FUSC family protein n=1 Tax=Kitasatospora mediocidica TaxID=58352 RepID=UPI00068BFECC|nr:FUSC family protein [Kitasatospora mediocidica]
MAADLLGSSGPAATAARRSVRVTLAACAGFYGCLYGLHQPVTATYALFASVAMAGLSRIPGSGRQRAAVLTRLLPLSWLLICVGSLLAVRTEAAVAGMLVIGFGLAFAAAGGPRLAGAAPGLQLLYILPCFPPYSPQTLDERLAGATLGLLLLIAAESLLLPDPPCPSYPELLAAAAVAVTRCTDELTRPPWALSPATRERARAASEALRPSRVPAAERPAGPGVRERALSHAGGGARELLARLADLPPLTPTDRPGGLGLRLLARVGETVGQAGTLLRSGRPGDGGLRAVAELQATLDAYRRGRVARSGTAPGVLRRQSSLIEAASGALTMVRAADIALGCRDVPPELLAGRFWYAGLSTPRLWWHRLAWNLSRRSVYFQNAVRTSVGLAAARTVAGVVSLPHGFWAMLAALTLTRTTTAQTRTTVRQALTGTLAGALVAAALLIVVGRQTDVYAAILPLLMLATFCLGPILGVGWAQGLFTLVVSVVFAQLAPAGWQLAEARFLDVLTGSMIGLLCGLLAWPRGAQDELRRATSALLHAVATTVTDTAGTVTARGGGQGVLSVPPVQHALTLVESSYAQAQSEPDLSWGSRLDWQAALLAGHHALNGSLRLLDHHDPPGAAGLGPHSGAWIRDRAAEVAGQYLLLAEELDLAGGDGRPGQGSASGSGSASEAASGLGQGPEGPPAGSYRTNRWLRSAPAFGITDGGTDTPPPALPLLFDTGTWLLGLANDLRRITPAQPP